VSDAGAGLGTIRLVSFDVLGTLVDDAAGLAGALVAHAGVAGGAQAERLVALVADAEWELLEALEDFRPHREILAESVVLAGRRAGHPIGAGAAERVAGGAGEWPLVEGAADALARLAERHRLALVANLGRADVERVIARLGVPVLHAVTSDDVASFKPEPDHFLALMHELELDEDELLHVSSRSEFDLETTTDLGIPSAYVDRRGEPLPEEVEAVLRAPSLGALAGRLCGRRTRRGTRGRPRGARRSSLR
jgi:2-haloacid dehalogenase/putative hydrolase of the HAD superfamily